MAVTEVTTTYTGLDLLPQHEQLLEASAISLEVATARGYRSIGKAEAVELGFTGAQALPGLLIPLWRIDGSPGGYQLRPDNPRTTRKKNEEGRIVKYETPKGQANILDVNPLIREELQKGRQAILVTEGARKADSLASIGIPAINLMGVYGWRGRNKDEGKTALADWEMVSIADSIFVMSFDSDIITKPEVHQALSRLKRFLDMRRAALVRVLVLPQTLDGKTGVDDYIASTKATAADLAQLVVDELPHQPPSMNGQDSESTVVVSSAPFSESRWAIVSRDIVVNGLLTHGWFLTAEGVSYYFDEVTKVLCVIEGFDMMILLKEKYRINSMEPVYPYLVKDMLVEAAVRGQRASVRTMAYYNPDTNVLYLDMGLGRMLVLDGESVTEMGNGKDGVLFTPPPNFEPWEYMPSAPDGILASTLIEPISFMNAEGTPHTEAEQRTLFLLWLLALAFESIQPTKPLALALGPAHSGKSSMFRRVGQLLFGKSFTVDQLRRDNEDDFFVATTTRPYVAFDNVDRPIKWLEDALATSATGVRITKRVLHTTNTAISYVPRSFLALTARTPTFRREDVSERLLIFNLDRRSEMTPEYSLLQEIESLRNVLLSDYAHMLNKVLNTTDFAKPTGELRLADFALIAARIGHALGVGAETIVILQKLQKSQRMFATEQSDLFVLLDAWLSEHRQQEEMDMGIPTGARRIKTADLHKELRVIAESMGLAQKGGRWRYTTPNALGMAMTNMADALSIHFTISHESARDGKYWSIGRVQELE